MTWSIVSTKSEEDERRVRGVHYTFTFLGGLVSQKHCKKNAISIIYSTVRITTSDYEICTTK